MRLRRVIAAIAAGVFLVPPAPAAPPVRGTDPVLETLLISLELEKKRAAEDMDQFERISGRLSRAEGDLARAADRLARLVRDGGGDRAAIEASEEEIAQAEAALLTQRERRRMLALLLVERAKNAVSLREEIARRRDAARAPTDPLTGRWDVYINPGSRHGVIRFFLDGTIVSGDYMLDGGFRGSVRGTFIGDRVTVQRIDAERGFDATFYGRLVPGGGASQKRLTGTWEATMIAPATGPTAGTWSGLPAKEPEESEK